MPRPRRIEDATILSAARALFLEKGAGATTKEVADRAGVSEGVLFQRFKTKADLFFAAMAPPVADPRVILPTGVGAIGDYESLEKAAFHVLAYFREAMPLLLPLVNHPSFDVERFFQLEAPSSLQAWIDALVEFLDAQHLMNPTNGRGVDEETETRTDSRGAATLLTTSMFGVALIDTIGIHGAPMANDEIRRMVSALWDGVARTTRSEASH